MRTVSVCQKTGLRRGSWTVEEDRLLSTFIKRYGHLNWRELPKYAGLSRCGKSCILRWMNYLKPDIKRGNFTKDEDDVIVNYVEKFGTRWSVIAGRLTGRTDNEIKNHWHTNLEKCRKESTMLKRPKEKVVKPSVRRKSYLPGTLDLKILESYPITPVSPEKSCTPSSTPSSDSDNYFINHGESMKDATEISTDAYTPSSSTSSFDDFSIQSPDIEFAEKFWTESFLVEYDYMWEKNTFEPLLLSSFSSAYESFDLCSFL
ncbi:hypothetical protein ACHQM5_019772 [Ranunculus cassubicifolius]